MNNREDAVIVGITGGIGSGKTTVANFFRDFGYNVLSSDDIAKKLMADDLDLKSKLIDAFGRDTYYDTGELNRKYLSEKVFANNPDSKENLKLLNSIVHPVVIDELVSQIEELVDKGETTIFVESALMIESGMADGYDYIIVVKAPDELVIKRVKERENISENQIRQRIRSQLSPEEKAKRADFVIENDGDVDKLKSSVNFIAAIVKSLKPRIIDEEE